MAGSKFIAALSLRCFAAAVAAAALVTGCSNGSSIGSTTPNVVKAADAAPAVPVTAKTALGPMYKAALAWSGDVQLMRLSPKPVTGFTNGDGKAAMWEAAFGSAAHHQVRMYTYSIATVAPDIHKGVSAQFAVPWAGPTRDAMPVDLSLFTVDSDAAYQASAKDAAEWLKKNPKIELATLDLGSNYRYRAPAWYVSWGDPKKNGYIVLIDATSGNMYSHK
jgi:hypothetical protein